MHASFGSNSSTRNERTFFSHHVTVFFSYSLSEPKQSNGKLFRQNYNTTTISYKPNILAVGRNRIFLPSVSPIIIIFEFSFPLTCFRRAPLLFLSLSFVVVDCCVVRKSIKPHGTVSESIGIPLLYTIQQ